MDYKTLLVFLDDGRACRDRLDFALRLARTHGAHLTGLYLLYEPFYPMMPEAGFEQLAADLEEDALKRRRQMEQSFIAAAQAADVGFDWRSLRGRDVDLAAVHARMADLAIVSQRNPEDENAFIAEGFPESVALDSGRPTLFLPFTGSLPASFKRVVVCWDGGREAARAVNDALPLLAAAEEVSVITIDENADRLDATQLPGIDIASYLSRHGVKANIVRSGPVSLAAGEWLLSRAADLGADLLVCGAYGHSRMRELILGGVTRTLLREMTVPVLMSH